MTIVSGPDHRNADWANDSSSFGQKMLLKMGWKQGNGLGKNQQGTSTNLRAVRREENLGIGAKTDLLGDEGFSVTSRNFHGVLATLQAEYGDSSKSSSSSKGKNKDIKSSKGKTTDSKKAVLNRKDSGLTLSSNRVTAGHAKKMRDAKDLTKKSKEEMAAIFGMKVEQYQNNSIWGRMSTLSSFDGSSTDEQEEEVNEKSQEKSNINKRVKKEKKKKSRKNKRKIKEDNDDGGEEEEKRKKKKSRKEK
mmetsp:Transcript_4287/g.8207  ORF Transcript_4287/g.8207 Transcript_4287/m.8207 type:complete len:248 (-) Transcript_4287:1132-1875(-)|eukprot:CAMPEP_0176493670 /NCGR_PEP_ID=MMETSP0200_2-20121128/9671_1 /TAXON_ID=947934 /ORGANISM="Chaetoceros sp., Strain GSL56" /LENGTH=247 /DNA_ID=CAMNT_0017891345 /DNA_START=107 /DNA_END=850 /DNA_ORIENTATION=-